MEILLKVKLTKQNNNDNIYLYILDYKSDKKAKELIIKDMENCINIRLLLCFDYSLNSNEFNNGKKPIFCDSLYFLINDKIISLDMGDDENVLETINSGKVELNGIVDDNKNDISNVLISPILMTPKSNENIVEKISISNEHPNSANLMSKSELDDKINNMHLKISETIDNINKGVIIPKPYKENNCQYCEFSDICMKEFVKKRKCKQ